MLYGPYNDSQFESYCRAHPAAMRWVQRAEERRRGRWLCCVVRACCLSLCAPRNDGRENRVARIESVYLRRGKLINTRGVLRNLT